jgi:copper chaperone CopZ
MHIITGILLSMLMKGGKESKKPPLLQTKWPIRTLHLLPGRVRFQVPLMVGRDEELKAATTQIAKIKGVKWVDSNKITSTVLIYFEENIIQADLLFAALIRLLGLDDELQKAPASYLNSEIRSVFESLNQAVYSKTNGIIDLYTAIPLLLAALGVSQIIKNKSNIFPTGMTLIWWAYNSLIPKSGGKI